MSLGSVHTVPVLPGSIPFAAALRLLHFPLSTLFAYRYKISYQHRMIEECSERLFTMLGNTLKHLVERHFNLIHRQQRSTRSRISHRL